MLDVLSIGELLIDFAPISKDKFGYPTIAANPGGAPANFLTPISKYGLKAGFIGKVGNDIFGNQLVKTLKENNIDIRGTIISDDYFTTLAFVSLDENGDRSFSFARKPGADIMLQKNEINLGLIDECKVFHVGTVSLTANPALESCHYAVEYAKQKGKIISFDPNLREPLWSDLNQAAKEMRYGLAVSDIVKISDNEVEFLYHLKPEEAISKILEDYPNIKILYLTCGKDGSYYATRRYQGFVKSLQDIKVVDTTGAGDIFNGSAMYKLLSLKASIEDIDQQQLEQCAIFATVAAGLSTTSYGGISSVVELAEIEKHLNNR